MENDGIHYISELDTGKDTWKLRVRILKVWKTTYSLDMIVMDERSDKIQASVKMVLCPQFEGLISEGIVVFISKFGIGDNNGKYPALKHRYKLNFYRGTLLKKCQILDFPLHGFDFSPFAEISNQGDDSDLPVDVIGCVVESGNLEVYPKDNGKQGKRLTLLLADLKGLKVTCTLWDGYAVQFHEYAVSNRIQMHVVIILQFARIRDWKGELTFQNVLFSTKLFIDSDIVKMHDFRKNYISRVGSSSSSQGCSQLSGQKVFSIREEFLTKFPRSTIDEVVDYTKPRVCVVLTTIRSLEERHGWFYIACRKHHKKVVRRSELTDLQHIDLGEDEKDDGMLYCSKCKGKAASVFPSFKLQLRVQDSTGTTSFVLFDTEMVKLIHKHAYEIREKQEREGDLERFPDDFNDLLNKTFLFKIDVSKYNIDFGYQVYTVMKVCEDTAVISGFMDMYPDDQHCFEALDRTLRDILRSTTPDSEERVFGGKVVVFGGDFRQILPVIPKGSRQDIVNASLNSSYLWDHIQVLNLTVNMRLQSGSNSNSDDVEDMREFANWLLEVGNGTVRGSNDGEADIAIPEEFLIKEGDDPILSIINSIYPDVVQNLDEPSYLQESNPCSHSRRSK